MGFRNLQEKLENTISTISTNWWNLQKIFPPAFFNILKKNIASTETNGTSKERSDTKLLGAGKSEGAALSGGLQAYLAQKGIEQKVNLMDLLGIWKLCQSYSYKESLVLSNLN